MKLFEEECELLYLLVLEGNAQGSTRADSKDESGETQAGSLDGYGHRVRDRQILVARAGWRKQDCRRAGEEGTDETRRGRSTDLL